MRALFLLGAITVFGCSAGSPKTNALGLTELTQTDLDEASKSNGEAPPATSIAPPGQTELDVAPAPEPEPKKPPRPRHADAPPPISKRPRIVPKQ